MSNTRLKRDYEITYYTKTIVYDDLRLSEYISKTTQMSPFVTKTDRESPFVTKIYRVSPFVTKISSSAVINCIRFVTKANRLSSNVYDLSPGQIRCHQLYTE